MPTADDHLKAMSDNLKKIESATGDEKKELLTLFYGSSAAVIEDLFPGTGLAYGFAQTQIDRVNAKEIEN